MEHMVINLIKYLKIYWKLIKFSASLELEYRFSFILEIIVEISYFIVTLFGMRVIFWNVTEIAGWHYNELLMLYGINMVFSELILGIAFINGLRDLPNKIAKGSLDLILIKPLNSQFAVSFWRPYFAMFPSLLAGVIIAYIGFKNTGIIFNPIMIIPFTIIFISGLVMAYSLGMIISTVSMWFINAQPLPMLAQNIIQMSKNPYSVYTGTWKVVFLTLVPVAFMVSIPTSTLLGNFNFWWVPSSIIMASLFLFASHLFWNFALKKYSSASS